MEQKKFRWAFIGCGGIAVTVARELEQSGGHEIAAVWNRTAGRAEEFARQFGGRVCETPQEAVSLPSVEGVYIAVTADRHAEYMELCIRCHKPVLCEKPFTVNAGEAERIFALARREGVYVSEAMWTWHNEAACRVREWLRQGRIGQVTGARGVYAYEMARPGCNPRLILPEMIGGALMDIGVYGVRYAYELFGMPRRILCRGELLGAVDGEERITMEYPELSVELDISMKEHRGEVFEITGTRGSIRVPMFHMAKSASLMGPEPEEFSQEALLYAREFDRTAREIREGLTQSRILPPEGTLAVMELMDECRRQMGVVYPGEG